MRPTIFRTERRVTGSREWEPGPRLVVQLDRGEPSPLVQLGWRARDGAEAVVGFAPGMTEFYGHRRDADGVLAEYGGVLEEGAYEGAAHRFRTEEGRGGEWQGSGELGLLIEDGGAPAERVTWRDQAGDSGSVALRVVAEEPPRDGELTGLVRTARASDENVGGGEVAENLLGGSRDKWFGHLRHHAWVEFTLTQPAVVRHYVLTSANDYPERDPRDWDLQGSNDGRHWVTLDSRAGEHFSDRYQPRGFGVATGGDTAYSRYRLHITGNVGSPHVQLSRVQFFDAAPVPAVEGFIGYYQRAGEGPIGYRGASVSAGPAQETAAAGLRTVEQWRSYLAEYSADFLRVAEENELHRVSDEQRAAGWLGFEGADEQRIAALEERLGVKLPPSYRAFLGASDGWLHLGPFMWEMRTTGDIGWLRDAAPDTWDIIRGDEDEEWNEIELMDRVLLVSLQGDAAYWLLDPGDVSADGEWAAYIWASWYPGLGDRCASFAELVAEERSSFESLKGNAGRGVRPDGADELLAEGRAQALRGEVEKAMETFEQAAVKGSGVAAYLKVILDAFLDQKHVHHSIGRGVIGRPHVMEAVGLEQVRAEAVPLFIRSAQGDSTVVPGWNLRVLGDVLPQLPIPTGDDDAEGWLARADAFVPPVLPEPPAFQEALARARALAGSGAADEAWSVIEAALPGWYSDSPHRIAPVVLLTDPALRDVITPHRARRVVSTPRGRG